MSTFLPLVSKPNSLAILRNSAIDKDSKEGVSGSVSTTSCCSTSTVSVCTGKSTTLVGALTSATS